MQDINLGNEELFGLYKSSSIVCRPVVKTNGLCGHGVLEGHLVEQGTWKVKAEVKETAWKLRLLPESFTEFLSFVCICSLSNLFLESFPTNIVLCRLISCLTMLSICPINFITHTSVIQIIYFEKWKFLNSSIKFSQFFCLYASSRLYFQTLSLSTLMPLKLHIEQCVSCSSQ